MRGLHPVLYDRRCIVFDFVIVGGWTVRDGEGGSPCCCVGAGRLNKAHEIVLTVAIVVEVLEEWFRRKEDRGDIIVRRLTGDESKVIRRKREDSRDFVRRHREGGTSVGGRARCCRCCRSWRY